MSEATSFVVSFTRDDLPFLAAAAHVDRKGIAWFDLDGSSIRLSVVGRQLSLVRPLRATVKTADSELPVSGFGIPAAELPSVMMTAKREKWRSIEIKITPDHDTGTFEQDRTVLTGGIPLEHSLFADLLVEDEEDRNVSAVTLCWDRPAGLEQLTLPDDRTPMHVAALRECLATAEQLIAVNTKNPQYEVLELANGFAHAAALNLQFCIETSALKGVDLRLHREQLQPLIVLLDRLYPPTGVHVATASRHYVFTDGTTALYVAIPSAQPPQRSADVLSGRPNTEAVLESSRISAKLKDPLRKGRGALFRDRVLHMELKDDPTPRFIMTGYTWNAAKGLGRAGKLQPEASETTFNLLTEQVLVEKVLNVCKSRITLQANAEWLYIRSKGPLTQLTAKIRAVPRDHRRIELQIANLPKLA